MIVLDGFDTVIVNPFAASAAAAFARLERDAVLIGGECNSWPRCYIANYSGLLGHAACRARGVGCYPNAGAFRFFHVLVPGDAMLASLRGFPSGRIPRMPGDSPPIRPAPREERVGQRVQTDGGRCL